MKEKLIDVLIRALKTFAQALFASLSVNAVAITNKSTLFSVVLAAVAAGFSAVMNLLKIAIK